MIFLQDTDHNREKSFFLAANLKQRIFEQTLFIHYPFHSFYKQILNFPESIIIFLFPNYHFYISKRNIKSTFSMEPQTVSTEKEIEDSVLNDSILNHGKTTNSYSDFDFSMTFLVQTWKLFSQRYKPLFFCISITKTIDTYEWRYEWSRFIFRTRRIHTHSRT